MHDDKLSRIKETFFRVCEGEILGLPPNPADISELERWGNETPVCRDERAEPDDCTISANC